MFVQECLDFFGAGVFFGGNEARLRGHDFAHADVVFHVAQVAAGNDANDFAVFQHRQAGEFVLLGDGAHFADGGVWRGGERVADDARLKAFDFAHFCRLLFGRHVFVNDGNAAQLGEGDGKPRFGDGVHRRGKEGDVEPYVARELHG